MTTQKVSDSSQPIKIFLMVFALIGLAYVGWKVVKFTDNYVPVIVQPPLGISTGEPPIASSTITNSQITCPAGTSTAVLAERQGRASFIASNVGVSSAYLCRATTCTATTGIYLAATSTTGSGYFEQRDGYTGLYSCFGNGTVSSTLNISYSQ